jgi:excisionase family DNA binding protein
MSETAQTTDMENRIDVITRRAKVFLFEELRRDLLPPWYPPKMYRVTEAADLLGMPYRKLLKAVNDGDIGHIRIGNSRNLLISSDAILDYVKSSYGKGAGGARG